MNTMSPAFRAGPALAALVTVLLLSVPGAALAGTEATDLHDAIRAGDLDTVQRLVVGGADVNRAGTDGETPLISAALAGHTDIVNYLLQRGAEVAGRNRHGLTALHAAAYAGHHETASLLLTKGAAANDADNRFGVPPLHLAAEENHPGVVEVLIAAGADLGSVEANGYTALSRAGWREHWDVVAMLIDNGAACQDAGKVGEWLHTECTKRAGGVR